ncbi:nitroreductase family deazaflavin-dependent oxidoreductase [Pseudonocardia ailaonensis]|uniref:Nitroreductase family deazaflavin-dependent oxidoreductase n=1 Tax=Pseudonocardia ailaonensis TaxID=367279 RepID=A0ABN2N538_9PSEU
MPIEGEYAPTPRAWVRDQVETYERSAGAAGHTLRDTGLPVIVVTYRGRRSGKVRKIALMRVEADGRYALVASYGGASKHPEWYHSLRDHPAIVLQDGPVPRDFTVRLVEGTERDEWWDRAVAAYPEYAEYQDRTQRRIPVFVAEQV